MEPTKSPLLSKTLWINVIMAALAFVPVANTWVVAHPEVTMLFFAGVNFLLRLITKDKITLN